MFRNLIYCFRFDAAGMRKAILWEMLHAMLLAFPSGVLLVVIWELFEPEPNVNYIWQIIGAMGGVFVFQLFVANKAMMQSNISIYKISTKMRIALGNKLQRLSLGYYKRRDPGDLASVTLQDVATFEQIFSHSIANLANAIFGTLVLSIFLLALNWKLGLTMLGAVVLILPLSYLGQWLVRVFGSKVIEARTHTNSRFLEYIQGMQHVKSYGLTGRSFRTLEKALRDLRQTSIRVESIPGPVIVMVGVVLELFFVLMVWLGLYLLSGSELQIPVLIAFLVVGYRLYEPLRIIAVEFGILSFMNISVDRIKELLQAEEQSAGKDLRPTSYDIQADQVTFSYTGERNVLENLNFLAQEGQMTALVGPSGSGKTTINSLLARFWEVDQGSIRIGGIDLRDMSTETVYSLISEVFQEVYLFDGTIYENILIGKPDASPAEVQAVAEKAQLMEFVEGLGEGLQTRVGEGGSKLSGGQKQRVSIARALLKDAPIVLLDEATSSLDPENEVYIQQAIHELVKEKTVIVIAHRLSTIQNADQILVLEDGHLVESGTHEALLGLGGRYQRMWNLQQQAGEWKLT